MAFTYHKPTRTYCPVCEELEKSIKDQPVVTTFDGKASSANNFPFHNWYNFVLGYSPDFPEYIISKYNITDKHIILDPFMGTATTNVVAKSHGIISYGVEANDFFINVDKAKLTWNLNVKKLQTKADNILRHINEIVSDYSFIDEVADLDLFHKEEAGKKSYKDLITDRPKELPERYISDKPYAKLLIISKVINANVSSSREPNLYLFFRLALDAIIVPSSNVSYGPGFGVKKAKDDFDVVGAFTEKLKRMISDIISVELNPIKETPFKVVHGDSRNLSEYFEENSVDFLITSPPYPGDHEYTKHTRLELMFEDNVLTKDDFRIIKKRMLVGSTTNVYKEDNNRVYVDGNPLITDVTEEIEKRLGADGATSGFEKLYTKLVWEYFGGMAKVLSEALKIMKKGGKFSLLVSDSHAFKMVHIRTAVILLDIAKRVGFSDGEITLWQNKRSTSHTYNLREEILTITK